MQDLPDPDFESLLTTIVSTHFPDTRIGETRFVGNGSCNVVYAVQVGDREVVIRLADRRYRAGEHAKEAWCIAKAAAAGVAGPAVYAVGVIKNTTYMVQEYIAGQRGDVAAIDQGTIWRQLGEFARKIHGIDFQGYPEATGPGPSWAQEKWKRYIEYGIESLTAADRLIELGVYKSAAQHEIRAIFEGLREQTFRFGLFHGDLSIWNTIVGADGKITLFDWGCAGVGIVPHVDISSIFRWMHADDPHFEAFLAGYGITRAEFEIILPQVRDFRLLESFDLVRWSIDRRPEELDDYVSRAAETWARD